jgi:hypothetical protein
VCQAFDNRAVHLRLSCCLEPDVHPVATAFYAAASALIACGLCLVALHSPCLTCHASCELKESDLAVT